MTLLAFGDYVLDTAERRLLRETHPVEIAGMPLAVLCHFLEHAADGRVVTKAELRAQVWRCKVEDVTIRSSLSSVREALGDAVSSPRYLQTHGKEGWRLLTPVRPQLAAPGRVLPPAPGGTYDPACYVPRPVEERILLSCLQTAGRPAVVFGPPGAGKRTLIERTLERATSPTEGVPLGRILRINLRPIAEPSPASLDVFLKELGRLSLEAAGHPEDEARRVVESLWTRPILAKQKLRELVLQYVLAPRAPGSQTSPVALVLCEVDRLASCPFQDDVFNMLRAWQEDRLLSSVRTVLETVLPPRLFPLGAQSPLWTKAQRIDVSCVTAPQLAQLADLHGVEAPLPVCEQLGALVGWNLYLGRVAIFHAAVQGLPLEAVLRFDSSDPLRFGAFADALEDLSHALERLEASGACPPLGPLLHAALQGVPLAPEIAWRLLQKGVFAETETRGRYRLRCSLYAQYFGNRTP